MSPQCGDGIEFKNETRLTCKLKFDWNSTCHQAHITYVVSRLFLKDYYYMTWVCSRSNACSDWLILGHYSPVIPTGRLRACKSQAKSHTINNLLTSNVRSLRENLKPRPCRIDLAIARSIRQGLSPRFSRKDLTLG